MIWREENTTISESESPSKMFIPNYFEKSLKMVLNEPKLQSEVSCRTEAALQPKEEDKVSQIKKSKTVEIVQTENQQPPE